MKYKNMYNTIIEVIEIDDLEQVTYKMIFDNKEYYDCININSFNNMIKLNNYKEMKGKE